MQKPNKYVSKTQAIEKLRAYCAYQERCHIEVRNKLLELGIYGDDLEEIIIVLIEEGFLNEERFAINYARGKFRLKKWGKIRIKQELKLRKISDYCIKKAMTEIEDYDYEATLQMLILKEKEKFQEMDNDFLIKSKIAAHFTRKGFENDLIWRFLNES
ncbi:MAG: RecX family transcriptional regulator [Saprospiraceae bacterium]|nr:RecX family transcriptional regulator [Saprospiraceae bacterium]